MKKIDRIFKEVGEILDEKKLPHSTNNLYMEGLRHIDEKYDGNVQLNEQFRKRIIEKMKFRRSLCRVVEKNENNKKQTKRK